MAKKRAANIERNNITFLNIYFFVSTQSTHIGKKEFALTAIFPHVWKAVNINMNAIPKTMMFNCFLNSEFILCFIRILLD